MGEIPFLDIGQDEIAEMAGFGGIGARRAPGNGCSRAIVDHVGKLRGEGFFHLVDADAGG